MWPAAQLRLERTWQLLLEAGSKPAGGPAAFSPWREEVWAAVLCGTALSLLLALVATILDEMSAAAEPVAGASPDETAEAEGKAAAPVEEVERAQPEGEVLLAVQAVEDAAAAGVEAALEPRRVSAAALLDLMPVVLFDVEESPPRKMEPMPPTPMRRSKRGSTPASRRTAE